MAEYLDPRDGYKLVTFPDWQAPQPWWIEVPEGANIAVMSIGCDVVFYKDHISDEFFNLNLSDDWEFGGRSVGNRDILWQRPTMPEELPFIDDEPRPKPRERVYAVLGDNVPEQQQFVINGIDYTKAIQLGAKALQLAIRTFNEAMKQK